MRSSTMPGVSEPEDGGSMLNGCSTLELMCKPFGVILSSGQQIHTLLVLRPWIFECNEALTLDSSLILIYRYIQTYLHTEV